jgi:hypothetical protein
MSALSEVSILIGQRARDIEKAREIFTAETRAFVSGILAAVRRIRSDPWTTSRVRIDLPREIEYEAKASPDFSSQFAFARAAVRFKKGTQFREIADVRFGLEFDDEAGLFAWQITLVPASKYNRIDDLVWAQWKTEAGQPLPAPKHFDKSNTLRFVNRALGPELTAETAFNDAKQVLEFLLTAEAALGDAVGLDLSADE